MAKKIYKDQINLFAPPSENTHVVSKNYVDEIAVSKVKAPVRARLDTNFLGAYSGSPLYTLTANANGELGIIDNVLLAVGDRIVLTGQTTQRQNGIYIVTDLGSATSKVVLTRALDFDISENIQNGEHFTVLEGGKYAMSRLSVNVENPFTLDVGNITFTEVFITTPQKYVENFTGDSSLNVVTVNHPFQSDEVLVTVRKGVTFEDYTIERHSGNTVDIKGVFEDGEDYTVCVYAVPTAETAVNKSVINESYPVTINYQTPNGTYGYKSVNVVATGNMKSCDKINVSGVVGSGNPDYSTKNPFSVDILGNPFENFSKNQLAWGNSRDYARIESCVIKYYLNNKEIV